MNMGRQALAWRMGMALAALMMVDMQLAHGATSCSASMTNVTFGVSDPFTGWQDVNATLNYSCSSGGISLLSTVSVRLCFGIGSGAQGSGGINPRRLLSAGGDALTFNLYRDAARTQVWGSFSTGGFQEVTLRYALTLGGSGSGSLPVYGRVPAGQTGAVPGSYVNDFNAAHAEMVFQGNEQLLGTPPYPASCFSGGDESGSDDFAFLASASVAASCNPSFSVQDVDFGAQGVLSAAIDTTATVSPQCTNTTPYQISLDDGLHANNGNRRMHNGNGQYVFYELYRDAARSQRWGDTLNVDTVAQTGTGEPQQRSIFGRVAAQPTPPAGQYSDTVTVTISY